MKRGRPNYGGSSAKSPASIKRLIACALAGFNDALSLIFRGASQSSLLLACLRPTLSCYSNWLASERCICSF